MTIEEVLSGANVESDVPARLEISGIEYDSRRVEPGYLFFAFAGAKVDGRMYAAKAIERGAVAVLSELEAPAGFTGSWIRVAHGRRALSTAAKNFYGKPDERIGITGITGTNGKTTTSYLVDSVLRAAGRVTGLVGTIEYHLAGRVMPAANTTPESLDVFRMLSELEREGGANLTMEVSSHALALGRSHGIQFHTAVFTNLTRDHLDFHGTMGAYFEAKRSLFVPDSGVPPKCAVLNADDGWSKQIQPPDSERIYWYGIDQPAEYRATSLKFGFEGLRFRLDAKGVSHEVTSPLVGRHNVYNILAALCTGLSYSIDTDTVLRGIANCETVPGRFERVDEGQPFLVVVDYAHTDDALRNLISVARDLGPKRVITVFGCGGDRDRQKRPMMGMAAAQGSDFVVVTSDNPRSEDPLGIINDAMVGVRRYDTPHVVEVDREAAIQKAVAEAHAGDIVLIAGKGHEPYQVLRDRTVAFDDREVARRILKGFGYKK